MTETQKIAAVESELRSVLPNETDENIRYAARRLVELNKEKGA